MRTLITRDFTSAFEQVDVLVSPTTPFVAFPFGSRTSDPYQMYLADLYTIPTQPLRRPGHLGAVSGCPRGCRSGSRSWRRRWPTTGCTGSPPPWSPQVGTFAPPEL